MFGSQTAQLQQQLENQQMGKQTPAIEFPQMSCPLHKLPIIVVSPKPDLQQRIFLCSKCVATDCKNLTDLEPLMTWEEFVKYLSEPSLSTSTKSFNQQIVEQKTTNIGLYMSHVNSQKYDVKKAIDKLQKLYEEKCVDLVANIQETLEQQKEVFNDHYQKLETEVKCDAEIDASIPKFNQIKAKMQEFKNQEEVEQYMKDVMRKKIAWKVASTQLKTLGQRSLDYYVNIIEEQIAKKPSFVKADKLVQLWTKGLTNLINQVKQESDCFEGIFKFAKGIELEIKTIQELKLLTSKMVKKDTVLKVELKQQKISDEQAAAMGASFANFPNLNHFVIDLEQSQVSTQGIKDIFTKLSEFKELECLDINLYSCGLKDAGVKELAAAITPLITIKYLRLNLGRNQLTDDGLKSLAEAIAKLERIQGFDIQLNLNQIKSEGAISLASAIQVLKNLTYIFINLSGFSNLKNIIQDKGASALCKAIGYLPNLETIILNLGHTEMEDSAVLDLCNSIKQLQKLSLINLDLFSNQIGEKGASKLSKAISKAQKISSISLNLNNNEIKKDGVREIVNSLKRITNSISLELNLRSVGVTKEDGAIFINDLRQGKQGQQFTKFEMLI